MITIVCKYDKAEKAKEIAKELRKKYKKLGLIISSSDREVNIKEGEVISKELNERVFAKELKALKKEEDVSWIDGTLYLNDYVILSLEYRAIYCYRKKSPDLLAVMEQDTRKWLYGTAEIFMKLILELDLLEKASTELIVLLVYRTDYQDSNFQEKYRSVFLEEFDRRLGVERINDWKYKGYASQKFRV